MRGGMGETLGMRIAYLRYCLFKTTRKTACVTNNRGYNFLNLSLLLLQLVCTPFNFYSLRSIRFIDKFFLAEGLAPKIVSFIDNGGDDDD